MNKKLLGILIALLVVSLFSGFFLLEYFKKQLETPKKMMPNNQGIIGGQVDINGCNPSTGYTYNSDIMACARSWEMTPPKIQAAQFVVSNLISVDKLPKTGVYIMDVTLLRCKGCFVVYLNTGQGKILKYSVSNYEIAEPEYLEFSDLPSNVAPGDTGDNSISSEPGEGSGSYPIVEGYQCPGTAWIDCMPSVGAGKNTKCNPEYINWVKANCSNFEGVAY